ncbi:hypothetical protein PybrP1_007024 [[Pythium] brassicae (nom. inval.)]|nr:hypothetical protein PybrP1_007024 [[Pythium] brassicae (nom. inval.)]
MCFSSPRCYACREFARVFEQVARVAVGEVDTASLGLDFARLPSVFALPRTSLASSSRSPSPVAFKTRRFTLANVLAG